ncbi:hypothetical protein HMN09_01078400 [Mycena chlorophos]|uniref:Uncharacterized protein n=1 Tax=Mycena chlorophos TaxID=658473 RepID=A0A8H6W285_MYCCL|nr:hypothetical protein HMN09_01078400 [Mycena chlorophos]
MLPLLIAALVSLHGASALLTPTGRSPSGKDIYTVPYGSRIAAYSASQIEVFAPNGTLLHTLSNSGSASKGPIRRQQDNNVHLAQAFYDCGVDASTGNATQITALNATFVVPPIPENYDSQLLYIGPGIEGFDPATNESLGIYQTALQYGGSTSQGGDFWSLYAVLEGSSFFVVPGPATPSSSDSLASRQDTQPIVNPGDTYTAAIVYNEGFQLPGQPPTRVWYAGVYVGPNVPDSTPGSIEISFSNPPSLVRAMILLQEEGAFEAADYPTGGMVFEDVQLALDPNTTTPGTEPEISWTVLVDPATKVGVEVLVDGGANAKIEMVFSESN